MARRTPTHLGAIALQYNESGIAPTEAQVMIYFHQQGNIAGRMHELPPPALECNGCGDRVYEVLLLSMEAWLCDICQRAVHEAYDLRHSGEFCGSWRIHKPKTARRIHRPATQVESLAIYRRDEFTCRYCSTPGGYLTVDHIDPEGGNSMENFATACRSCNSSKGSRTPEEAGMELVDA